MSSRLGNINVYVRDVERAAQFYVKVFGLTQNAERSALPSFALLDAGGVTLTLQDAHAPGAVFGADEGIELGFAVDDIAATRARLQAWNVRVSEIEQMGWGGGFDAVDLDGHRLTIYRYHGD
ncbi:MAG: VOC family protein [Anaerolineae bacterium]|nr:VOC family protein [Anaerolineae bacterium]